MFVDVYQGIEGVCGRVSGCWRSLWTCIRVLKEFLDVYQGVEGVCGRVSGRWRSLWTCIRVLKEFVDVYQGVEGVCGRVSGCWRSLWTCIRVLKEFTTFDKTSDISDLLHSVTWYWPQRFEVTASEYIRSVHLVERTTRTDTHDETNSRFSQLCERA